MNRSLLNFNTIARTIAIVAFAVALVIFINIYIKTDKKQPTVNDCAAAAAEIGWGSFWNADGCFLVSPDGSQVKQVVVNE